jgi:hypothetical protein
MHVAAAALGILLLLFAFFGYAFYSTLTAGTMFVVAGISMLLFIFVGLGFILLVPAFLAGPVRKA